jgi:hypothetical protein
VCSSDGEGFLPSIPAQRGPRLPTLRHLCVAGAPAGGDRDDAVGETLGSALRKDTGVRDGEEKMKDLAYGPHVNDRH